MDTLIKLLLLLVAINVSAQNNPMLLYNDNVVDAHNDLIKNHPKLQLWIDASDSATVKLDPGTNKLDTIFDKSSQNNHFISKGSSKPDFIVDRLYFNTNTYLESVNGTPLRISEPAYDVFMVYRSNEENSIIIQKERQSNSGKSFEYCANGKTMLNNNTFFDENYAINNLGSVLNKTIVVDVKRNDDNNSVKFFRNFKGKVSPEGGSTNYMNSTKKCKIGLNSSDLRICEIIVFNGKLWKDERWPIIDYLVRKWGSNN